MEGNSNSATELNIRKGNFSKRPTIIFTEENKDNSIPKSSHRHSKKDSKVSLASSTLSVLNATRIIRHKSRSQSSAGDKKSVNAKQLEEQLKTWRLMKVREANEEVQDGYNALYDDYAQDQNKKKPKPKAKLYQTTPVAHNIKENDKIRRSVIGDYLQKRRESQVNVLGGELTVGEATFIHRKSVLELKAPNVLRKSFLELKNPLYPDMYTDTRKGSAADNSQLFPGTTDIRRKSFATGNNQILKNNKDENADITSKKFHTEHHTADRLRSLKFPVDMLDRETELLMEGQKGKDVLMNPKETIRESEEFFHKLKKEMAGTPLKVPTQKTVRLKDEWQCQQQCNGKNCTVTEAKDRCNKMYPWLIKN